MELQLIQPVIHPLCCKQRLMAPFLNLFTPVYDDDPVSVTDSGKPVCDSDGRPPRHERFQPFLDQQFCLRIHACGGFVQHQDLRVEGYGTGEGDQLPLSGREVVAPFADLLAITAGELFNETVCTYYSGGFPNILPHHVVTEADIILDRAGEDVGVLKDDPDPFAEGRQCYPTQVNAVQLYAPPAHVVKP